MLRFQTTRYLPFEKACLGTERHGAGRGRSLICLPLKIAYFGIGETSRTLGMQRLSRHFHRQASQNTAAPKDGEPASLWDDLFSHAGSNVTAMLDLM